MVGGAEMAREFRRLKSRVLLLDVVRFGSDLAQDSLALSFRTLPVIGRGGHGFSLSSIKSYTGNKCLTVFVIPLE